MKRMLAGFVPIGLVAVLAVACATPVIPTAGPSRAANALSGNEAAAAVREMLSERTFIDDFGSAHVCSAYVSKTITTSWEPDTKSWLITLTGDYEPANRIFCLYESDMTLDLVIGKPIPETCLPG